MNMMQSSLILILLWTGYASTEYLEAKAGEEMSTLLTEAENEVKEENTKEEQVAKEIANSNPSKDDAFRWVQKFLVSFPRSIATSNAGKVLERVTKAYLRRHKEMTPAEAFQLVENIRPLKELGKLADSDDTDSEGLNIGDLVTCPYQPINCTGQENAQYRTFDGSCNNLRNPLFGKSFTPLLRFLPPDYQDNVSKPRVLSSVGRMKNGKFVKYKLKSARKVSSTFSTNMAERTDDHFTYMVMTFGQFVDHDLDMTAITKMRVKVNNTVTSVDVQCGESSCDKKVESCFPIPIPKKDRSFAGKRCLTFVRSQGVPNRHCTMGPRQHLNQITSFLDASAVYGSTKAESNLLRNLSDSARGWLKTSEHPFDPKMKHLLPQADNAQCKGTTDKIKCFKAGDARVNEANHLSTIHTAMVREHNRIEEKLHHINPHWDGEKLFQETRKIIGAVIQRITYKEYLPAIFSRKQLREYGILLKEKGYYKGYDDTIDASISNVFATAAYRFGHSTIPAIVRRPKEDFQNNENADLFLSQTLFSPSALYNTSTGGMDAFMRALASQRCTLNDPVFSDQLSTHLFSDHPPLGLGTDLYAINIQRGRDHGLPGYNKWREFCGLEPVKTFAELKKTIGRNHLRVFEKIYRNVDDIDLYPAGLAEKTESRKTVLGPTFSCILGRQFRNLRNGDRFWHEKSGKTGFTREQLQEIRKMTLAKLFCTNSDHVSQISRDMMRVIDPITNPLVECQSIRDIDFSKWKDA